MQERKWKNGARKCEMLSEMSQDALEIRYVEKEGVTVARNIKIGMDRFSLLMYKGRNTKKGEKNQNNHLEIMLVSLGLSLMV